MSDSKIFNYVLNGLELQVTATEVDALHTTFEIKCISGAADINALYWNDADTTGGEGTMFTLSKSDNSLNMNGTGETWDGSIKLSSAGLGSAALDGTATTGLAKSTYLTAGETYTVTNALAIFDSVVHLGVRATSTSTPE